MRVLLAPALVLALALAGCVSPQTVDPAGLVTDQAAVVASLQSLLAGVPCEVDDVGPETSENLLQVGNIEYDGSAHGEIDIRGDWMLAARYQAGGFEVVNVADPQAPVLAGVFQSEEENAQDVKWMPDARTAVVGVNQKVLLVDVGPVLDAPVGSANATPQLLTEWQYPTDKYLTDDDWIANMHMLTTARIADEDYVFVAPNTNSGVWVLQLVDGKLEYVTNFGAPLGGGPLGPHDMSLRWDAKLDAPVLYVANGFEGWLAFDVSDPAAPEQLGMMLNLDPAPVSYTHTVLGEWIGERRLVITIGEVGTNAMKVYDATDLAKPVLLAVWWADKTAPHMPQHNLQIVGDQLYVAHYTQGVFVFNLSEVGSTPLVSMMEPVAHFAPPQQESADTLGFGNIWDVVVHRGLLYVNDMSHGTAVVGYGCLAPGDEAATSVN